MHRLVAFSLLLVVGAGILWWSAIGETPVADPGGNTPTAVGRAVCARCHSDEHSAWVGSHHDRAMQEPTGAAVLGDFSGVELIHGSTHRFVRDGEAPAVEIVEGGTATTYPVRYLFGVSPLQQVLLETTEGRLQSLPIAWATDEAEGGPRWFPIYPEETPPPGDPFHWRGLLHNWNHMCAECHTTALAKGFDETSGGFTTTWSEIDVSCEACHGPGSAHVRWAEREAEAGGESDPALGFPVRLRRDPEVRWVRAPGDPIAHREPPLEVRPELDVCGRCHSRRNNLADRVTPGRSLHDTHRLELLSDGLYHLDGQILEEVFVLGSFLQSPMHAAGVTCSDCHDSHSGELHLDGDLLCVTCHDRTTFGPDHTHHPLESPGSHCADCHMPARTYMQVDPRRDHSFRVPRPDLSVKLGVPNPCTGCHPDRDDAWAAATVRTWFPEGRSGRWHFAEAFDAARSGAPEGNRELLRVIGDLDQAAIVRATAVAELIADGDPTVEAGLLGALGDRSPLVRRAALQAAALLSPPAILRDVPPLLGDPHLSVRLEATRRLAPWRAQIDPSLLERLELGIEEYRRAQRVNADRPDAYLNLGSLAIELGEIERAEADFRRALEIQPTFGPAAANLADLYRATGRDTEAIALLESVIARSPDDAGLHHTLGLAFVRVRSLSEALRSLERAVELAPESSRFTFVLAVARHDTGDRPGAIAALREALERRPRDAVLRNLFRQYTAE